VGEPPEPWCAHVRVEERLDFLREVGEVGGMTPGKLVGLAELGEPFTRELGDGLEEREPRLTEVVPPRDDQAVLREDRERVQNVFAAADSLRRRQRRSASKHREPREEPTLPLAEQIETP